MYQNLPFGKIKLIKSSKNKSLVLCLEHQIWMGWNLYALNATIPSCNSFLFQRFILSSPSLTSKPVLIISVTAQRSWQTAGKRARWQWWNKEPQVVQVNQLEEAGGPADPTKLPPKCCWQDLHRELWRVLDEHARPGLSRGQPSRSQQQLRRVQLCEACPVPAKAKSSWLRSYFRYQRR